MGTLMVMLSAAMWGLSGVCGQFLFESYHPDPVWLIAVRQVAAGILFLLYMNIKGIPLFDIWQSGRKNIKELLWFTLGLLGAQFMYYYTISVSNAPTSTILQYQAPIYIVLWQAFVRKQMPEGRELLGVVLAMTGVFLISTHGNPAHLVISPVALVSGELSAIALCIYMIAPENILKQFPTMLLMGWGQLISSLFLLPFCNILDSSVRAWKPAAAGAVAFIILGGTIIPFTLFLTGVKIIGPTKASLISCFEPLATILFTVFFLSTVLLPVDYAGMACIMVTVFMLTMKKK
ncbi:Permease of the drug/metabolite transporter (DMT) superfamily [Succiniclasticum ruminis]|uniref:Permease of the drug/metabolite transporter (DMT) superfamily n=1 Tax=Succiniclasticum ruminis TaxID=40841 RepID=A0A1G6KNN6_9FIRM|nr:EamA family transporter [Succiniclasticum ruminis]SDC32431.1 Permease of the drug/metabolite transporter (DMT) superfamily [Succiniclasticum ruminis]